MIANIYSHVPHNDILVNNRPHTMVVPQDYHGAEKYLMPSDAVAIIML